jgi:hypothetical protein
MRQHEAAGPYVGGGYRQISAQNEDFEVVENFVGNLIPTFWCFKVGKVFLTPFK